jgi:hypothetical protein
MVQTCALSALGATCKRLRLCQVEFDAPDKQPISVPLSSEPTAVRALNPVFVHRAFWQRYARILLIDLRYRAC